MVKPRRFVLESPLDARRPALSRADPQSTCYELSFRGGYPIDEMAEVALEDYARALTRSAVAEAVRSADDPALVRAVHVCGLGLTPTQALLGDLEDFARSLVAGTGGGLGWS